MKNVSTLATVLLAAAVITPSGPVGASSAADESHQASAGVKTPPNADAQIASLEAMCAENADAMAARRQETSLYERLGGEEGIHALTREIVRLHLENDDLAYLFDGLDADRVAHRVALFMIAGTGGPSVYDGPELETTHAHMKLTNTDFLIAGGDVIQAMKNLGYGQNEVDEVVCALVGLRDQVILPAGGEEAAVEGQP